MKFKYRDKVNVVSGFYSGIKGIVHGYRCTDTGAVLYYVEIARDEHYAEIPEAELAPQELDVKEGGRAGASKKGKVIPTKRVVKLERAGQEEK